MFLDRGATPWSWTALCSKKNKVATPFHSNRMERRRHIAPFLRSHAANHASKEAEVATANTDRGRAPGLVSAFLVALTKRFRTARPAGRAPLLSAPSPTPQCDAFSRHVRQMSGHDVSVAAEKRARWKSAFMAAPTKRCSPPRPAWRASVGRAAPHSSHPCHALNLPYGSYGAMEQFIQSPPSSGTLVHLCRSGRLLALGALHATCTD